MEERIVAPAPCRDEVIRHWLLNLAVEFGRRLTLIFPTVHEQALNVNAVPGCTSEDYARNLLALFEAEMITLSSELSDDDVTTRSGVSRVLNRLVALPKGFQQVGYSGEPKRKLRLDPGCRVYFKLTASGGEAWETAARPDWSRFLMERSDFEVADFYSVNRDLLTAYMGWYADINEARILPETVEWDSRKDSEIVYWKKVPIVHHAFCRLEVKPPANTPKWLWDWYCSATRWHRDPWDLPDWPLSSSEIAKTKDL